MDAPKPSSESKSRRPSAVRWKKVAAVREEIRRGTYDDPARWEKILDRLLLDLREPPVA